MKLKIYRTSDIPVDIAPAPVDRAWMDRTPEKFANRCLPLRMANQAGWVVRSLDSFAALWTGSSHTQGVKIILDGPPPTDRPFSAVSHFGSGVLTFTIPVLLRTEPGWQMQVMGPPNVPYLGIAPLSGIVETDWACHSFTMNWRFTEPMRVVRFEKGDPICQLLPVRLADIEAMEPELLHISDDPELDRQHRQFSQSRTQFNADLLVEGSAASEDGWQKQYFQGRQPDGTRADAAHFTKLKVCPLTSSPS